MLYGRYQCAMIIISRRRMVIMHGYNEVYAQLHIVCFNEKGSDTDYSTLIASVKILERFDRRGKDFEVIPVAN